MSLIENLGVFVTIFSNFGDVGVLFSFLVLNVYLWYKFYKNINNNN